MFLEKLKVFQFRGFQDETEFVFDRQFTLIIGINGVGKSTVLYSLQCLLSQMYPRMTSWRMPRHNFIDDDITVGKGYLISELGFDLDGIKYSFINRYTQTAYAPDPNRTGEVREQTADTPTIAEFVDRFSENNGRHIELPELVKQFRSANIQTFPVYFSAHRSLLRDLSSEGFRELKRRERFWEDALVERQLRLRDIANWLVVTEQIHYERGDDGSTVFQIMEQVIRDFLPGFERLLLTISGAPENSTQIVVLKLVKNGIALEVRQLSDGERQVLALILDLTRRLAMANPDLTNPVRDGRAIVLIDELDLHLHPQWQRNIVKKLIHTFPNCQFIATTHSPLIVGEVEPSSILWIDADRVVYHPPQSKGMDINFVVEYLMGTPPRDEDTTNAIEEIKQLIENRRFSQAQDAVDSLRDNRGQFTELVRLQSRIDRLWIKR